MAPLLLNNRFALASGAAATRAGCTRRYIAMLCKDGTLDGFRLSTEWLVYVDSLKRFIAERTRRKLENNATIRDLRMKERATAQILAV